MKQVNQHFSQSFTLKSTMCEELTVKACYTMAKTLLRQWVFKEQIFCIFKTRQLSQNVNAALEWSSIKVGFHYGDYRSKLVHLEAEKNICYV